MVFMDVHRPGAVRGVPVNWALSVVRRPGSLSVHRVPLAEADAVDRQTDRATDGHVPA